MNVEVKSRLIDFLGDLDDSQLTPTQVQEVKYLYGALTRRPGRQPGYSPNRKEAYELLAQAGPDGKELAS